MVLTFVKYDLVKGKTYVFFFILKSPIGLSHRSEQSSGISKSLSVRETTEEGRLGGGNLGQESRRKETGKEYKFWTSFTKTLLIYAVWSVKRIIGREIALVTQF